MPIFLRGATCALLVLFASLAAAQDPPAPDEGQPKLPEIADEPKTIDPATLMPKPLAEAATVDLSDASLREVINWLQEERKIPILLEQNALANVGVTPGEPVSERLDESPIYLLLNRLRSLKLDWFYEDDILHITSWEKAEERLTTAPYNIGDLRDAGYDLESLEEVIRSTIEPDHWDSVGGPGALNFLGDVLFVRQTDELQRRVQGLLAALRRHGRQTFAYDPPQHLALRQNLQENVSVDFRDAPLEAAVRQLAEKSKIDLRLDVPALREIGVRERSPVTLKLSERKLETVLQALVVNLELTWILRDGAVWITTPDRAEDSLMTAVYDVRDLCRDAEESEALREALLSQTDPDVWATVGGPGDMQFARPGTLVVYNVERLHRQVLQLLETYRAALRASRRREREALDPQEVITVYYRLNSKVAEDLASLLPKLVQPETWQSDMRPDAPGEVFRAASNPDLPILEGKRTAGAADGAEAHVLAAARAVLIVRQTRKAHDEIAEVIRRVEHGDAAGGMGAFGGGGGFGGGGFGGGFF